MREIDLVLDFAVNLGDRMLDSGANLERVNTSIHRILHTYGFQEISLFSLSSILMVSACDLGGERAYRQLTVRGGSIHLERLKKLNQLVFTVCETKPEPSALHELLLTTFGPGTDSSSIVTACTLMIIPGIPLVNAVRNLFCGNEMNGVLQLMSVLLASLCLALGLTLSYILLGGVPVS